MTDFDQIATGAREQLIAELNRTVEEFEEERHRSEESAAGSAANLVGDLETLRALSTSLLGCATALHREVARLVDLAEATAAPSAVQAPAEAPPSIQRRTPLDVIDSVRDSIAETPLEFGPRRRRFEAPRGPRSGPRAERWTDIPDGVRVFVEQLRIAGVDDVAIAKHLEAIGVENPATVVSRISPTTSSATG